MAIQFHSNHSKNEFKKKISAKNPDAFTPRDLAKFPG